MVVNLIGRLWLSGAKYAFSKARAGAAWQVKIGAALARYGVSLDGCRDLDDIVRVFSPRWAWLPDPVFQIWDVVYPPELLLARGGDDCDGWAMAHAQAIDHVMAPRGWQARIISVLADPWTVSHHFAVAVDPEGRIWAVQPQPERNQSGDPVVHRPFTSFAEAASTVMSWYGAKVVWFDVRHPDWTPA